MRLCELYDYLDANALALQSVPSVDEQTVAGVGKLLSHRYIISIQAICTATHGSSMRHGCISASVVELTLVTGTGNIITIAKVCRCAHQHAPTGHT